MDDLLLDMKPSHEYLVCVDSDGCALDNMELKHKECFCPATVGVWELQGISRFVREAAEFVNLYSRTRGTNRFPAIVRTLELAHERDEVKQRGYTLPDLSRLKEWISSTPVLSGEALAAYCAKMEHEDSAMRKAVIWTNEVDENIAHIVKNISPFPRVRDALEKLSEFCDIAVVSATPHEALVREWRACGLDTHVSVIAGQELGPKRDCVRKLMQGKYQQEKVLKIGDALGDHEAAKANGILFFPIVAGLESESWAHLCDEAIQVFQRGGYKGEYMEQLVERFYAQLLDIPPWRHKEPCKG